MAMPPKNSTTRTPVPQNQPGSNPIDAKSAAFFFGSRTLGHP